MTIIEEPASEALPLSKKDHKVRWALAIAAGVILMGELLMWLFTTQLLPEGPATRQNYLTVISFCLPATWAMFLIDAYILPLKTPHKARNLIAGALVVHIIIFIMFGLGFATAVWDGGPESDPMRMAMRKGFAVGFLAPHHLAIIGALLVMLSKRANKKAGRLKKIMIGGVVALALAGGALFGLSLKYETVLVFGNSMYPTLKDGDLAILEKDENYKQQDIVFFELPDAWKSVYLGSHKDRFIKRIVAVEGDTLSWDGTSWAVNGEPFSHLTSGTCKIDPSSIVLKKGEMFVIGDVTYEKTLDSREAFCRGLDYIVRDEDVVSHGKLIRVL